MRKGFACGVFDLFHPGHVLMLRECKENCDYLTVAVNTAENFDERINPGKRKPFFSAEERKMVLEATRYVDEVVFYTTEEELTHIMESGGFHVRFLGDDYKGKPITARHAISELHYLDRSHGYSTTGILDRILNRIHNQ
jgi:glycerol-3-phosphate cytidylyltransferase